MEKEERVMRYLDLASMPENLPYDTSAIMKDMGLTKEDILSFQKKKEAECSLKPVEKRNLVVRQVIKPLLKEHGFSTAGLDWHREMEDSFLIIHMDNSRFNSILTGASFRFHISASRKKERKESLSRQWIYNQQCECSQFDFLPCWGMLSPYFSWGMYKIDGYKNFLPSDTPVEQICKDIGEDFGQFILPALSTVKSLDDFLALRARRLRHREDKEVRLLRYYYAAQSGKKRGELAALQKELGLSPEDIVSHIQWLDRCRENSSFTKVDVKDTVRKAVNGYCSQQPQTPAV